MRLSWWFCALALGPGLGFGVANARAQAPAALAGGGFRHVPRGHYRPPGTPGGGRQREVVQPLYRAPRNPCVRSIQGALFPFQGISQAEYDRRRAFEHAFAPGD